MDIYIGDIMHFNMEQIFPGELRQDWSQETDIRVVANLPFNVSTPLIIKVGGEVITSCNRKLTMPLRSSCENDHQDIVNLLVERLPTEI
jgi:16S rRNA A1518/A1519 N6-dimethyltransferase RsmA/KsgA/DIM1 with predicted DNA glycosylase/AP lyase activity